MMVAKYFFLCLFFILTILNSCYAKSFCDNSEITITNQASGISTITRLAPNRPTKLIMLTRNQTFAPGGKINARATPLPKSGFGRALGAIFIAENNTNIRLFYYFKQDFTTNQCVATGSFRILSTPANATITVTATNGNPGKINFTITDLLQ